MALTGGETRAAICGLLAFIFFIGCKPGRGSAGGGPQSFPVQVVMAEAKRQPISERLPLVGSLAANEMVEIKSETDGKVSEILFNEGQPVKKGDLLIRLDESKFAAALAEAEANLKLSRITFERNEQLFKGQLISQQEFDQAVSMYQANEAAVELRRRQLQDTRIFAPFSGTVGARLVSPGQVIARNTTMTWLVDASVIKAEFDVPERFLGEVKLGQKLELIVAAYPREKFHGDVYFIAPQLDSNTRTALVKATIPNTDGRLRPGMFANLELTTTTRPDSVVIPETALVRVLQDDRAIIYTVTETNTVALRTVKLGIRLPGEVEVVEGLRGGERIVVEGVQKTGPGATVVAAGEQAVGRAPARAEEPKRSRGESGQGESE